MDKTNFSEDSFLQKYRKYRKNKSLGKLIRASAQRGPNIPKREPSFNVSNLVSH